MKWSQIWWIATVAVEVVNHIEFPATLDISPIPKLLHQIIFPAKMCLPWNLPHVL